MTTIEQYSGDEFPYVLVGSGSGSAGDLMFSSAGTFFAVKTQAAGTGCANTFSGVLEANTPAGSYASVGFMKVYQLPNAQSDKVLAGQLVYIATSESNGVGTLDTGTAIGVCVKSAAATDSYISVKPIPWFESRAAS
jgi:predicted RecA/RadA family phage recombinase